MYLRISEICSFLLWHTFSQIKNLLTKEYNQISMVYQQYFNTALASLSLRIFFTFSWGSVQFSCSVMSDSLQPHELQHARPPCPSPIPRVHSNSCPSSRWCNPAISSSVVPFSSCPQSLPALKSLSMSQLFAWGGQSIGVSALSSSFQWTPRTDLL